MFYLLLFPFIEPVTYLFPNFHVKDFSIRNKSAFKCLTLSPEDEGRTEENKHSLIKTTTTTNTNLCLRLGETSLHLCYLSFLTELSSPRPEPSDRHPRQTQCQPVAESGHTNLEVSFKDFILPVYDQGCHGNSPGHFQRDRDIPTLGESWLRKSILTNSWHFNLPELETLPAALSDPLNSRMHAMKVICNVCNQTPKERAGLGGFSLRKRPSQPKPYKCP